MNWGFSIVAPAATVVAYASRGSTTDYMTLDVLNLVEMVLLILLSFQALEERPNNIITQPGNVFFNNNLVVGFYIASTFVQAIRVLSTQNTGPFDLVPFFLQLTIALQINQQNGRILAWLLFAIAAWRFVWYSQTTFEQQRAHSLRLLISSEGSDISEPLLKPESESLPELLQNLN